VLDGWALDTFQQTVARFHTPEVLDTGGRASNRALFESLRRYGDAPNALAEGIRSPVIERARAQFLAAAEPVVGHPSQPILALYTTRTVRGISTYPSGLLGREARVIVPGSHHRVVTTLLAVSSADKRDGELRRRFLARIDPRLAALRSTDDTPRQPPTLPRRWRSEPAVEAHRSRLAEGPLADHISPALHSWIDDPGRGELPGDLRLGMEGVSMLHAWWSRYRDRLHEADAGELRG
jgi:hypothetical protein